MDGKTVAIGVLALCAVFLAGLVASGLRTENAAYGQGGVYATFLAVSANVQDNYANFVVLDTEARKMLFYKVDIATSKLEPIAGRDFKVDFKHTGP
jgi:hypothetical protein